jgi:hypothetical protein
MKQNINKLSSPPPPWRGGSANKICRALCAVPSRITAMLLGICAIAAPPAALAEKLYHVGNSHTIDFDPQYGFRVMGTQQGVNIDNGWHINGGKSLKFNAANPNVGNVGDVPAQPYGVWGTALAGNNWDVVTLQTFGADDGSTTPLQEAQGAMTLINYTLDNNTDGTPPRFFIYTSWTSQTAPAIPFNYSASYLRPFAGETAPYTDQSRAFHQYMKAKLATENLRGATVEVIPVGEVFLE